MDKCCLMLMVITLIGTRVVGLSSLSRPPAGTSVVRAASIKLSRMDMLFVLQAKSDVSSEGSP